MLQDSAIQQVGRTESQSVTHCRAQTNRVLPAFLIFQRGFIQSFLRAGIR